MTFGGHLTCPKQLMLRFSGLFYILLTITSHSECAVFTDVHWSTAIKLSHYDGYKTVSVLSYKIPENSLNVDFTFQAKTKGKTCNFKTVHIYFQHGSYPLVNLYNETYPDHFYLKRTDSHHVVIQESADATTYSISRPRPGLWYFATFLPKEDTNTYHIQQKGLDSECLYGMFIMVTARGLDNIPEVETDKTHKLHLKRDLLHNQKLFRYMLPKETVAYTVRVDNCVIPTVTKQNRASANKPSQDNATVENTTYTIYQKGKTLPSSSSSSSPSSSLPLTTYFNEITVETNELSQSSSSSNISENNMTSSTDGNSSSSSAGTHPPSTTAPTAPTTFPCPVSMVVQEDKLPSDKESVEIKCENESSCKKRFLSPLIDRWLYMNIEINPRINVHELKMDLSFDIESCESLKSLSPNIIHTVTVGMNATHHETQSLPQTTCTVVDPLGRFMMSEQAFNISYMLPSSNPVPVPVPLYGINIPDYNVLVSAVQIREPSDIGGTLRMFLEATKHSFPEHHPQYAIVYLCLMKNSISGGANTQSCDNGISVSVNTSGQMVSTVYVPYPEAATYYLAFNGQCFLKINHQQVKCSLYPLVNVELGISGCVDNQCGEYGACRNYISGVYIFSSCVCFADWRGYGCTDGSEARSRQEELLAVLLLTLTNLFFIPAFIVAVLRKHYIEAWVYLFTMFFSGFYHACDASNLVYYCLLDYDVLSFGDFVGSISSFWVTLLALARIPDKLRWFGHMLGVMGVAVGTEYDRHGIWTFATPACLGIVVMFLSWIVQCKRRAKLYPPKRYYFLQLLPGVLLAATGLVLFGFFETEVNYKYTHSAWHVCMSTCIVFLLPRPEKKVTDDIELREVNPGTTTNDAGSSESSDLLIA